MLGKTSSSTDNTVMSFFKIMFGSDFSKILYLPPKFGSVASTLVDQETVIEDWSGERWRVTILREGGAYAVKKGWSSFVARHGIERGDLLVFDYLVGSHFHVRIYDKSGCESRKIFGNGEKRKRSGVGNDSNLKFELVREREEVFVAGSGSGGQRLSGDEIDCKCSANSEMRKLDALSKETSFVEPDCMIYRDMDGCQDDGGRILNLFDFEVKNAYADCRKKSPGTIRAPTSAYKYMRTEAAVGSAYQDPVTQKALNRAVKRSNDSGGKMNMHGKNFTELQGCKPVVPSIPQRVTQSSGREDVQDCESERTESIIESNPLQSLRGAARRKPQTINRHLPGGLEQAQTHDMRETKRPPVKVKSEASDLLFTSTSAVQFPCKATFKRQSFLELPTHLSSAAYEGTTRSKKVVYLQDLFKRLWPVLYHDRYNVKLLTSGWESFSKANSIRYGDVCTFKVRSESEGIYDVDIHRS